ncbi:MAG: NeuD/PglB/VioB family sugar acetyltransferase [Pseudomonadota bacterium]
MSICKGLLILGCGGHARSVADVALAAGVESLLFIDDNADPGEEFLGFAVQRDFSQPLPDDWMCLPAAGDNYRRQAQVIKARQAQWPLATLISPTATIGRGAVLDAGSFVGHHAHVGPMARVGTAGIINTAAVVEHDCVLGDYVHVSINAAAAGRSRLGDYVLLGAGATVIDSVVLADHITIGAGGVVINSIRLRGTYVGVPARLLDSPARDAWHGA